MASQAVTQTLTKTSNKVNSK